MFNQRTCKFLPSIISSLTLCNSRTTSSKISFLKESEKSLSSDDVSVQLMSSPLWQVVLNGDVYSLYCYKTYLFYSVEVSCFSISGAANCFQPVQLRAWLFTNNQLNIYYKALRNICIIKLLLYNSDIMFIYYMFPTDRFSSDDIRTLRWSKLLHKLSALFLITREIDMVSLCLHKAAPGSC